MKKWLLLILILPITLTSYSQISGVILDEITITPIQYTNICIENSKYGSTSDLNGHFIIKEFKAGDALIISAIGYNKKRIIVMSDSVVIKLAPRVYEITEIVIKPSKVKTEFTINALKRKTPYLYFSSMPFPRIYAKYFEYKPEYQSMLFLKEIKVLTYCRLKEAKINLRLFSITEKGEPGNDILKENHIITVKTGKKLLNVDLERDKIAFPSNGIFIALEWLMIEDNKKELEGITDGNRTNQIIIRYEPNIGALLKQDVAETWEYEGGNWFKRTIHAPDKKDQYLDLAIELTLTK